MKFLTAIALFVLTTSLYAATPYSFKCVKGSDGSCSINNSNAHVMQEVQTGIFGGTEGEYRMFYAVENGTSALFVYKGQTEVAQAEGKYLAVPTGNGYAGVLLVEGLLEDSNTFIQPSL